ncbi:MAG TPA: DNA mismatch repair protein MutS, partial [Mesotoga infera]|nr:DNA mismatch repair protein MutS [Mesotoga infera]
MSEITPMMQQYLEVKNNYKDCIVLFRLGDFYETFFDDARLVADELKIVLTSRNGNPMAGVPYHAIDSYVRKLISAGHKVAICEQTEDPAQAKGLVRREVTRVMTPGTIMEDELLAGQANNYILTVSEKKGTFAVVLSDISTGEVVVTSCESLPELLDIISSFEPAQILLRESLKTLKKDIMTVSGAFIEIFEDWNFALSSSLRYVKEFYSLASTDHLELDFSQLEALGALFKYLQTTNFKPMKHLSLPRVIKRSETMQLDASTIENLNLLSSQGKGSLIAIMDESVTGMGKRKLKQWLLTPLTDVHKIERRLDTVQSLSEDRLLLEELREYLGGIFDLERIVSRLASDRASPRDLQSLRNSLRILPYIKQLLVSNPSLRERGERIVLFSKELE